MTYRFFIIVAFLVTSFCFSQSPDQFFSLTLDPKLSSSSNAVVRYEKITVDLQSIDKIILKTHRIVTVLNKNGNRHRKAVEFYSDDSEIKSIEAKVYDGIGREIKRFKERDFRDESAVSDFSIYEDDRVKYLDYIPLDYPYTIEYVSEVEYSNTAFFPSWTPLDNYYLGIEHAEFQIVNTAGLNIRLKKENFTDYNIESVNSNHFIARDIPGIPYEAYAPSLRKKQPRLKGALTEFSMIGVEGQNRNWQDFGQWMHERLLVGTDAVPESTRQEILKLTEGVENDLDRAKIVYKYMQDRTRYISIQIGIGGWKPMMATEVDELGYGDCKGLTNYTKALMDIAGVDSYYTVIYGGSEVMNLDPEFSSLQGNHVILALPVEDELVFLECTSQTVPFGFIAGFTDDRDALMVTSEGGKIVHTTTYGPAESYLKSHSLIQLDASGGISGEVELKSTGYFYSIRQPIESKNIRDRVLEYKEGWDYLNNLEVGTVALENDRELTEFNEKVPISVGNYASKLGDRLLLQPNIFNRKNYIPPRYSERQLKFEIPRSYQEIDEYIISYPKHMEVEAVAENVEIDTKFGSYKFSIEVLDDHRIKYQRVLLTKKGLFENTEYDSYRDFRKRIAKSDKAKIVLKNI